MPTGSDLVRLAETRLGEKYSNVLVPKDNADWHGPWDCAEFASWVVFQVTGSLYGCVDNLGDPATTEAYSGAWVRDARGGKLIATDQATAATCAGVILVREPPLPGKMGHVAISDGHGRTVEAAGIGLGVRRGAVEGRLWHQYARIPGVDYTSLGSRAVTPKPIPFLLQLTEPTMKGALVREVQWALKTRGFNPGRLDGHYGPHTVAAVYAFQKTNRLVADGVVGPATARKLGIRWPD